MLTIEKTVLPSPEQWKIVIEGTRNPMNSWHLMDSKKYVVNPDDVAEYDDCPEWGYDIGANDHKLMMNLAKAGTEHSKYRRMIPVWVTINAPLYWWKEADTYTIGKVQNSCSTMHKIHSKEFTLDDFSHEQLLNIGCDLFEIESDNGLFKTRVQPIHFLKDYIVPSLNVCRDKYLATKDKDYWWQMIQMLPTSYNQKRTLFLNYEVLAKMYRERKNHKLDEWHTLCDWIKTLPYSEIILAGED